MDCSQSVQEHKGGGGIQACNIVHVKMTTSSAKDNDKTAKMPSIPVSESNTVQHLIQWGWQDIFGLTEMSPMCLSVCVVFTI